MQAIGMRVPTCEEWDRLVKITNGENAKMHWGGMFSWCQDSDFKGTRMVRGCHSERYLYRAKETERCPSVGFRPVFDLPLGTTASEGSLIMAGTLYMNNKPVKVPKYPEEYGSIQDYIAGTTLELGAPMVDPDYQVNAFRVGDILIADRVLLKNISWPETGGSPPLFFVTESYDADNSSKVIAAAKSREEAWLAMYRAFVVYVEVMSSSTEGQSGQSPLSLPSEVEARAGWGRSLNGLWAYISQDHATINDDVGTTGFSISEFALDRNLFS